MRSFFFIFFFSLTLLFGAHGAESVDLTTEEELTEFFDKVTEDMPKDAKVSKDWFNSAVTVSDEISETKLVIDKQSKNVALVYKYNGPKAKAFLVTVTDDLTKKVVPLIDKKFHD